MSRLFKALALLALLTSWMLPAQLAMAAGFSEKPGINVHKEEDSEDQDEHESEDSEDHQKESEDSTRQFAPPPLVVKHKSTSSGSTAGTLSGSTSTSGTNAGISGQGSVLLNQDFTGQDYVTTPIRPRTMPDGKALPQDQGVDPTQNEPLSNLMNFANYEDPAAEFMHKAYFGLAILGTGAIAMAGHTLNKARKLAKASENDYDYEGQN
ncbi:MAG: hypothetical protein ACKOWE_03575 [Micrococcales bacterium]